MPNEDTDFYASLRNKFQEWAKTEDGKNNKWVEYLLLTPDLFHLLCKLVIDSEVSTIDKAKLGGAIAYFVSPIDLIPEALVGPVGYVDDIALTVYVLNNIIKNNPEVVQRNWVGDGDILKIVQDILNVADKMVGSSLWNKIKGLVK